MIFVGEGEIVSKIMSQVVLKLFYQQVPNLKNITINITQTKHFNANFDQIKFINEINQTEISRERTNNKLDNK